MNASRGSGHRLAAASRRGETRWSEREDRLTARTLAVEADPPIEVEADSELIGQTPAKFEVVPRALKLAVP